MLKLLFFVLIGPGSVIVYIPFVLLCFFGPHDFFKINTIQYVGALPIVLGLFVSLWCFHSFLFTGKGTPVPIDPPQKLVKNGLYRFIRNPMYLGILLLLLGEAVLFKSFVLLIYSAIMFCAFQIFIVAFEEPSLHSKFGNEYEKYCNAVPRWIFHKHKNKKENKD